jgi:hypothetical protein
MKLRTWMASAAIAGFLGVSEAPAQVQFKTMELHSIGVQPQEPVYVNVAHRRHHRRVARQHYVMKRRSKVHSAAIASGRPSA